jgi:hypothetical protein
MYKVRLEKMTKKRWLNSQLTEFALFPVPGAGDNNRI